MKPRSDSRLKTLPEERQRGIVELLRKKSLAEVRKELRADGIETSCTSLSEFFSWWQLKEQFRELEGDTETMLGLLKKQRPELSEDELARYGNSVFQLKAIKLQDVESYTRLMSARHRAVMDWKKLDLRKEELRLQREKFEFDAAKAALARLPELRVISQNRSLDQNAKIEQVRLKLFGQVPAALTAAAPA